jgi:hypothetical protein
MKISKLFVLFLFLISLNINSQNGGKKPFNLKRFLKKTPWTFNIGGHVIDDDGHPFSDLFNVSKSWNFLPFPTRMAVDAYIKNGLSAQIEFAYTTIKSGKVVNSVELKNSESYSFYNTDINCKYHFDKFIGNMPWFSAYTIGGLGFTNNGVIEKRYRNTCTINLGLGFNFWVFENLGVNLNSSAKFSVILQNTNYLQHSIGIIYRYKRNMGNKPGKIGNRYSFLKSKF